MYELANNLLNVTTTENWQYQSKDYLEKVLPLYNKFEFVSRILRLDVPSQLKIYNTIEQIGDAKITFEEFINKLNFSLSIDLPHISGSANVNYSYSDVRYKLNSLLDLLAGFIPFWAVQINNTLASKRTNNVAEIIFAHHLNQLASKQFQNLQDHDPCKYQFA